jgi:hypothetical protein
MKRREIRGVVERENEAAQRLLGHKNDARTRTRTHTIKQHRERHTHRPKSDYINSRVASNGRGCNIAMGD